MAGTITSDLTAGLIDAAEVATGWLAIGTWGAAAATSVDIVLQGTYGLNARSPAVASYPPTVAGLYLAATSAGLDLSTNERHLFIWIKCISWPAMVPKVFGGMRVSISSDVTPTGTGTNPWYGPTNSKNWFVGGADADSVTGWTCYVVDPNSTPDLTIGTPLINHVDRAGLGVAAIKTVGGGSVKLLNIIWDKIAYGTGLIIINGTAGTPVTLTDIYATDMSNANCFGVLTQSGGIYYAAGKFLFGTTGQTAVTYFKDTNQVMVFQNFPVASTFYEIKLQGATNYSTTVQLGDYSAGLTSGGVTIKGASLKERRAIAPVIVVGGTGYTAGDILTVSGGTYVTQAQVKVITVSGGVITELRMETAGKYSVPPTGTLTLTGGTGSNGTCTLTFTGGSIWTLTASAANQTLNLYGCSLSEMLSATLASTSTFRGCTIMNSGTVTPNGATIDSCTFQDLRTATPISATYGLIVATTTPILTNNTYINCATALSWNINADTNSKLDGSKFISGGTGYGIELGTNTPATITLTNVTFTGYGANGTTNAAIYNNSGKTITINVAGGSTPTYKDGTGASTTIVSSVNVTIHVQDAVQTAIENARVHVTRNLDSSLIIGTAGNYLTDGSGNITGSTVLSAGAITIDVRKSSTGAARYMPVVASGTVGASSTTINVTLTQDTVVSA